MMNKVFSAEQLDIKDPLRDKAQAFSLPANTVYLDGNSLGPMPKANSELTKLSMNSGERGSLQAGTSISGSIYLK